MSDTTLLRIDPTQLDAIRTEVMSVLDAIQGATARKAEDSSDDDPARHHHHTGMRDGASLAAEMVASVFDRIARQGVLLIDD